LVRSLPPLPHYLCQQDAAAILIFYSKDHDGIREAYWSQVLTLYSILVAAAVAISQENLTKFHGLIAIELVASPLTLYMAVYGEWIRWRLRALLLMSSLVVRSFFGHRHRLDHLMGKGHFTQRFVALGTVAIWVAFLVYLLLPSHLQQFSQPSCEAESKLIRYTFLLPVMLFVEAVFYNILSLIIAVAPLVIVTSCWIIAIYHRRHQLWYRTGARKRPGFWDVW
jgi:hypothetical protein